MVADELKKKLDDPSAKLPKSIAGVQKLLLRVQQQAREGQTQFRTKVLERCKSQCILTGWDVPEALEAAHLVAFADRGRIKADIMNPLNGVALRADLHRLFDSNERLLAFRLCFEDGRFFVKLQLNAKLHAYLPGKHGTVVEGFPPASLEFLRAKLVLQDARNGDDWPNPKDADEMAAEAQQRKQPRQGAAAAPVAAAPVAETKPKQTMSMRKAQKRKLEQVSDQE